MAASSLRGYEVQRRASPCSGVKSGRLPTENDKYRCTHLVYRDGATVISHIYGCTRNLNYIICKPFMFRPAFKILDMHTKLIHGDARKLTEVDAHGVEKKVDRPTGINRASKMR